MKWDANEMICVASGLASHPRNANKSTTKTRGICCLGSILKVARTNVNVVRPNIDDPKECDRKSTEFMGNRGEYMYYALSASELKKW